jgi:hypothetical protein
VPKAPKTRELTAREKGILFAKNSVPKPKINPNAKSADPANQNKDGGTLLTAEEHE